MADENDSGEKTEAPTPKRREEAREQGNVARSADLSAAALLLGILLMLRSFPRLSWSWATCCRLIRCPISIPWLPWRN
jgi:flagellar biosynthetic protein FlhB